MPPSSVMIVAIALLKYIPLYVKPAADSVETDTFTVQQHYENWRAMSERVQKYYTLLNQMIEKGGEENG